MATEEEENLIEKEGVGSEYNLCGCRKKTNGCRQFITNFVSCIL